MADVRELLPTGAGGTVEVATDAVEPATTEEDVDAVLERAERALSAPVRFTRSGHSATLDPEAIGGVLVTRIKDDNEIVLRAKPDAVWEAFGESTIEAFEQDPESARFEISGGSIELIEGREGFEYHPGKAARQLVEV
ncbi:MAG: hypothetical protein KY433_09315, partial [Actinobacteria bacterium]|nr:hypothetical protein [Actinomycetota bacterium]